MLFDILIPSQIYKNKFILTVKKLLLLQVRKRVGLSSVGVSTGDDLSVKGDVLSFVYLSPM